MSSFLVIQPFEFLKHSRKPRTFIPVNTQVDTDAATRAWGLMMSVIMARKDQFPAIAASFGLNPGSMHALLYLDPDAPRSMSALASDWKCDASNVTWLVDRLEEKGYAERRAHPTDRRVRTVALTRKGVRVREQIQAKLHEAPVEFSALSTRELEMLARILAKITPDDGAALPY
jgi:DNA-binding MarR family transcriptional regulator